MSKALDQITQIESARTEPETLSFEAVQNLLMPQAVKTPDSAFHKTVRFDGKFARFLSNTFPGRTGKVNEFLERLIEKAVTDSGCTLNNDGSVSNPAQAKLDV